MQILNIAAYKFIALNNINAMRTELLAECKRFKLRGTILLSKEGINLNLAGCLQDVTSFKTYLKMDSRFTDISFRESYSETQPFKRLKVKIKKEIITLRQPEVDPLKLRATSIEPAAFKKWLDEKRDIAVLDVRNEYEIKFGTFENAINLHLNNFEEFPNHIDKIKKDKPIVMFCTGGIRCEKAALYLLQHDYSEIYQLEGGILNYFAKVGADHYQGECFVFDDRIAVNPNLMPTKTKQCLTCEAPIPEVSQNPNHSYCAACE